MKIDQTDAAPAIRLAINALDVCRRLPILPEGAPRKLAWLLQYLSLDQNRDGLAKVAEDLVSKFPERCTTPDLEAAQTPGSDRDSALRRAETGLSHLRSYGVYRNEDFQEDIWGLPPFDSHPKPPRPVRVPPPIESLRALCREAALETLPKLLRSFCTSAKCYWPGTEKDTLHAARALFAEDPVYLRSPLESPVFKGLATCLLAWMEARNASRSASFYLTNIGRRIWGALDKCLQDRSGGVIEGKSGRGKSAAVRAWCDAHAGEARLVTLQGFGDRLSFFRSMARAVGIGSTSACKPSRIRERVGDVLQRSGLGLVIDEAHYLLPEPGRRGRPELIDWLHSAVREAGIPVVLVTTEQFAPRLGEIERRDGWNAAQFRRRFSGQWVTLEDQTTEEDLSALAQRMLPMAGTNGVKLAVAYAQASRDVSGLADLVTSARRIAMADGRSEPAITDIKAALRDERMVIDQAMEAAMRRPFGTRQQARRSVLNRSSTAGDGVAGGTCPEPPNPRGDSEADSPRRGGSQPTPVPVDARGAEDRSGIGCLPPRARSGSPDPVGLGLHARMKPPMVMDALETSVRLETEVSP